MKTFATLIALSLSSLAQGAVHSVSVQSSTFSPASLTIQPGDTVVFTFDAGTHSVTSVNNSWTEFVDSPPGKDSLSVPFATEGTYNYYCKFHGTATSGMKGSITVSTATGIRHSSEKIGLAAYPNPVHHTLTLQLPEEISSSGMTLKVVNPQGDEVNAPVVSDSGNSRWMVDFSELEPGIYFCQLYSGEALTETKRIVVGR